VDDHHSAGAVGVGLGDTVVEGAAGVRGRTREDHLQVGGESNGSNGSNELGSNEFMQ